MVGRLRTTHAETDRDLTPKKLIGLVDAFEDLIRVRHHLTVTELQLKDLNGKHLLEIGLEAADMPAFSKNMARRSVSRTLPQNVVNRTETLPVKGPESAAFNADGENLPFRDNSFDIVYSTGSCIMLKTQINAFQYFES